MKIRVERRPGALFLRFWKRGCVATSADQGECGRVGLLAMRRVDRGSVRAWTPADGGRPTFVAVRSIEVGERRQGLGTKLYEAAARAACDEFGAPLASDTTGDRSAAAEGFWRKQVQKGRARRLHFVPWDPSGTSRRRVHVRYALKACPAPKSLAGLRRRRRRA